MRSLSSSFALFSKPFELIVHLLISTSPLCTRRNFFLFQLNWGRLTYLNFPAKVSLVRGLRSRELRELGRDEYPLLALPALTSDSAEVEWKVNSSFSVMGLAGVEQTLRVPLLNIFRNFSLKGRRTGDDGGFSLASFS
jgi:hypothetical protein